ncbi:MAG: low molecular weight phosphotyrosine protein phosphatase [Cytophagales bacterium]|nr:low molecular weight phosphotyrosine protein phosphatase [Cytophagales bacterium]
MKGNTINVLFVCLGNICRSPMAEAIFHYQAAERGLDKHFEVDSCGTGAYHLGTEPDHRTLTVLTRHGISTKHRGRQLAEEDFNHYHHLIAMDHQNLSHMRQHCQNPALWPKLELMRAYDTEQPGADVPDPYYGDMRDFEAVYALLVQSCSHLLQTLALRYELPLHNA